MGYYDEACGAVGPAARGTETPKLQSLLCAGKTHRLCQCALVDPPSDIPAMSRTPRQFLDEKMMARCIELSHEASKAGEIPFAALICKGGDIVAEATNRVVRDGDITRHAELLAISQAQKVLERRILSDCSIYANVEPCPMCSFPIREAQLERVVFAIRSPLMGGMSRWNILRDREISDSMPEAFGDVPEVTAGVLVEQAEKVWRDWNPVAWGVIRYRGLLDRPQPDGERAREVDELPRIPRKRRLLGELLALHRRYRRARSRSGDLSPEAAPAQLADQ
jgi:tRNA(adenine34) deaminase